MINLKDKKLKLNIIRNNYKMENILSSDGIKSGTKRIDSFRWRDLSSSKN